MQCNLCTTANVAMNAGCIAICSRCQCNALGVGLIEVRPSTCPAAHPHLTHISRMPNRSHKPPSMWMGSWLRDRWVLYDPHGLTNNNVAAKAASCSSHVCVIATMQIDTGGKQHLQQTHGCHNPGADCDSQSCGNALPVEANMSQPRCGLRQPNLCR